MNLPAIHHINWLEYREALPDGRVRIRIRAARGDWDEVTLLFQGIYNPDRFNYKFMEIRMELAARDGLHDWFQADFLPEDPRPCYLFRLEKAGETIYFDQDGVKTAADFESTPFGIVPFPFAYVWPPEGKPGWARGAAGYQIFPDRFRRGGPSQSGLEPWTGGRVSNAVRYGGDLKGILEAVPHIKGLGAEIVYLTPIFLSDTAHRYNVHDYYLIDPMLGSLEDLKALAGLLHDNGMRLVLDGVFNHCGTRFAPFADARLRGKESPFYSWFFLDESKIGYQAFAFEHRMPKLNLRDAKAADYFLQVGRYWVREAGIDGWRLDVSPEVWPDFWRRFRHAVKEENPEAILIAECWDDSREWVSVGDMFDGTMHYILSRAVWRFFALDEISLEGFDAAVNRAMMLYPSGANAMQWTFLSSHDTPRFLTRAGKRLERLEMAAFFQFTAPGVPIVYYGDELGMEGKGDPDCRRPMRWDLVDGNPTLALYRRLAEVRKRFSALREGDFRTVEVGQDGLYAYLRTGDSPVLCALCTGESSGPRELILPSQFHGVTRLFDWMGKNEWPVRDGRISLLLKPGRGYILSRF